MNRAPTMNDARGMTLVETMVSVGIMALALGMTMQLLVGTSQHVDMEIKESDLAKRTTSRLTQMLSELENITAVNDANFTISNQGPASGITPGGTDAISTTQIQLVGPCNVSNPSPYMDGYKLASPVPTTYVGNCITFRIPTGTYNGAMVWSPNSPQQLNTATSQSTSTITGTSTGTGTGTGTGNAALVQTIRYRWAPTNRNGVLNRSMGTLVREVLDINNHVISWDVLEDNVPPCDYSWDPNATPVKMPTGFAIIQAAVEPKSPGPGVQAVQRLRTLTITLQRCINTVNTITGQAPDGSASSGGTWANSTSTQTVFLKTP